MRVLICGGSGFLGRHSVNAIAQLGHDPVVRSRHSRPALDFSRCTTPDSWREHLLGIDAVINAVGVLRDQPGQSLQVLHTAAPAALFSACAQAGIKRVVQISALGVDQSQTRYATTKRAADDYLLALGASGQLNPVVVRPSIIFGSGGASSKLFLRLAGLPMLTLPAIMRSAQIQPVAVRDLAEVVANLATCTPTSTSGVIEIGGPEPISIEHFIASLRTQMGHQPATVGLLPDWLSKASARMGDRLPWMPWCSEAAALLEQDNISNPQTLKDLLGRPPTPIQDMLATLRQGGAHAR